MNEKSMQEELVIKENQLIIHNNQIAKCIKETIDQLKQIENEILGYKNIILSNRIFKDIETLGIDTLKSEQKKINNIIGKFLALKNTENQLLEIEKCIKIKKRELNLLEDSYKCTQNELRSILKEQKAKLLNSKNAYSQELIKYKTLQAMQRNQRAEILAKSLTNGQPCPVCGSLNHPSSIKSIKNKDIINDLTLDEKEKYLNTLLVNLEDIKTQFTKTKNLIIKSDYMYKKDTANLLKTIYISEKDCEQYKKILAKYTKEGKISFILKEQQDKLDIIQNIIQHKILLEKAYINYEKYKKKLDASIQNSPFKSVHEIDSALIDELTLNELKQKNKIFIKNKAILERDINTKKYQYGKIKYKYKHMLNNKYFHRRASDLVVLEKNYNLKLGKLDSILRISINMDVLIYQFKKARKKDELSLKKALSLISLAETISGKNKQNLKKMDLLTYVLASKLEKVTIAASMHFYNMSKRYRLTYNPGTEKGKGRKAGLGIDILDTYNNDIRQITSLSGGEIFIASLSLALGLADVIQNENSGIKLNMLFIDEGFGSLDMETLDSVMKTLDIMKSAGRILCVISHVEEMRQRIPCQIEIQKTQEGSIVKQ